MMFKLTYDKAVLETDALTTSEAMVALAWASVCDYKTGGNVRQSFESVAQKAKVSRRTAIRLTQSLVEKGWLKEVERQAYKPTVYALVIPDTSDTATLVVESSDTMSLVTNEAPLVTNETRLVTNEAPTSDTVTPYKNITRTKDKNLDKNKNTAAAEGGPAQSDDTLSLAVSSSNSSLGQSKALPPSIEKVLHESRDYEVALTLFLDEGFRPDREGERRARLASWEADARYRERVAREALEKPETVQAGKDTQEDVEAGRLKPGAATDPSDDEDVEVEW